jgi:hypothetical protein
MLSLLHRTQLKLKMNRSKNQKKKDSESDEYSNTQVDSNQQTTSNPSSIITQKNHPASQIIGEKDKCVQTRRRIIKDTEQSHIDFISMMEPKNFNEASKDGKLMNEELDQIEKNDTWEIIPSPTNKNVIRYKWVYKNKMNKKGNIVRNKARLV